MNRTTLLKSIGAGVVAFSLLSSPVEATVNAISLVVRVDNVQSGGGPVRVAMFDSSSWLGRAVDAGEADATAASVRLNLTAPSVGRYGFAIYQDANRDGRLNRNIVGLPTEPVAFSNGAVIRFGPPSFQDAAVHVSAASETVVSFPQ